MTTKMLNHALRKSDSPGISFQMVCINMEILIFKTHSWAGNVAQGGKACCASPGISLDAQNPCINQSVACWGDADDITYSLLAPGPAESVTWVQ